MPEPDSTQAEHDAAPAETRQFRRPAQDELPAQHVAERARRGREVAVAGPGLAWQRGVAAALAAKAPAGQAIRRGAALRLLRDGAGWTVAQWPEAGPNGWNPKGSDGRFVVRLGAAARP